MTCLAANAASFCSPMMPQMWAVAVGVAALHMDDGHVRGERRHDDHILAGVGILDAADIADCSCSRSVAAVWFIGIKGKPGGTGLQAGDHAEVGVFLPLQPAGFQFVADDAQRTDARVADIGEDQLFRASGSHHLVVDQVGCGARQGAGFCVPAG